MSGEYGQSAEEAHLSYLEDQVRSGDPLNWTRLSYEEAVRNLDQALLLVKKIVTPPTATAALSAVEQGIRRRELGEKAHHHLMKCHGWLGNLQSALDTRNEAPEVAEYAATEFTYLGMLIQQVSDCDRQLLASETERAQHALVALRSAVAKKLDLWLRFEEAVRTGIKNNP